MVTTRPPKTIVKPTALGPVANTDTKLLIYGLFQKGRVLAQDGRATAGPAARVTCVSWILAPARGCVPRSVEKEQRTSTPSSGYQIKRQPPRVREPRSDVGSRRCVVVESGQRR